jgi:cytochrome c-type biogenesis protein CcmH
MIKGLSGALALVAAAVMLMGAADDPSDRLKDPAQEARARALFQQLRCVVCQNESIDDSEADLAQDLRRIVRGQIAQGRTDAQVRTFLVQRYGQFILLKPPFSGRRLCLAPFDLGACRGSRSDARGRASAGPAAGAGRGLSHAAHGSLTPPDAKNGLRLFLLRPRSKTLESIRFYDFGLNQFKIVPIQRELSVRALKALAWAPPPF